MPTAPHHTIIEGFEAYLGDPESGDGTFSFARSIELDEADAYPSEQCDLLHAWGLGSYYVPASVGGKLASYEELLGLLRAVARRNLSTASASGKTFLGAVHVWVAGTEAQKQEVFSLIREGGQLALAYHEKNHGGDFFAVDMAATPTATGYRLSGEKWLVNNATRGVGMTVFARTDPAGGPRGFSILFVNKRELLPGSFSHTPPLRTLGIRGADFSGIKFTDCDLSAGALVGELGAGLELSLRSFQLTRTILPGLSLGAGDTALRTVLNFAVKRERSRRRGRRTSAPSSCACGRQRASTSYR
jgi:alkylation response protein AidB-like acyl-CoA dehydrogenase